MNLHIAVNLLWLIMISVEELSIDDGCMLWDIKENKLIFTFRTSDFSNPLRLIDNRGKEYARCSFEQIGNQSFRCTGRQETQIVSVDVPKKEVRFTIHQIKSKDVDGIWTCAQGYRKFTNNVSKFNGIIGDTDIYIEAKFYKINNTKRVSLQCSACRNPRGNTVEFLINNTSEVSITYNPVTGSCTDENGQCNPDICSCLLTGNKFNATFPFYSNGYITYSCDMQFTDEETLMIFSKTANLRSNGNDFEVMSTNTTINKKPQARNKDEGGDRILATGNQDTDLETENVTVTHPVVPEDTPNENTGNVTKWVLIAIVSTIIAALLILTVAYFIYQKKNRKESGNEQSDPGENIKLLEKPDTPETVFPYSTEKFSSFTTMKIDAGNNDDEKNYIHEKTMTEETTYFDAQTMTNDEKNYNNAETMTDEKNYTNAETMTVDEHPVMQAQTAIKRPNSFDIEQKYPGIIVFEILKMKREIVFTGIKDHNKKLHQLFVVNTNNFNTQCFDLEKKPYNITSLDDEIVALSYPDKREVDMINIKTGRLDRSIKVISFAIFQSDDQLFVINVGKLVRITKDGCSIESFDLPTPMIDHISVYDKRLYYTCNESLYCCALNGTLIWKFKPKLEKRLSGVTTDSYGNIFVSSAEPVNVLVISKEGQFLKNISYDFRNETKPVKLHFDKQHDCLAILRHSNNMIDFFDVRQSK